eukprot:UN03585
MFQEENMFSKNYRLLYRLFLLYHLVHALLTQFIMATLRIIILAITIAIIVTQTFISHA